MFLFGFRILFESVLIGIIALIFSSFRLIAILIAKYFHPKLVEIVSLRDSRLSCSGPTTPDLNIVACLTLKEFVPTERLRNLFQTKIIDAKDSEGNFIYERLKWTWEFFLGYSFWKRTDFKLENHFRDYDLKGDLSLPNPCYDKDVEKVLGGLCAGKWQEDKSPWEILIVQNFKTETYLNSPPKTVIVIRADHVLMDGRNWIMVLHRVFDIQGTLPSFKLKDTGRSIYENMKEWFKLPFQYIELCRILRMEDQFAANLPFPPDLAVSVSENIPVKTIRTIQAAYGVSYAAVMESVANGALQQLLQKVNAPVPKELTSAYAVPMPNEHPSFTGNHYLEPIIRWKIQSSSPVDRLKDTERKLIEVQESGAVLALHAVFWALSFIPIHIRLWLMAGTYKGNSVTISNFPVLDLIPKEDGIFISDFFFMTSCLSGSGICSNIGGANGNHRFATVFDKSILPGIDFTTSFRTCVEGEVQKLLDYCSHV